MKDYSLLIKLMFFVWGFLGIAMHILKEITDWNKSHPDKRIASPRDMLTFMLADLPGLGRSVGSYIIVFGVWAALGQIHKYYLVKQIPLTWWWLSTALTYLTNPWLGAGSPFMAFTADSTFNKATEALEREFSKKLGG